MEHAEIEINLTAGSLTVSSLAPNSLNFVEVDSVVRNGDGDMRVDFRRQGNEGRLRLSTEKVNRRFWGEGEIRWEAKFTRNTPLTVDIKSAASNMELALGELEVAELRMDVDVGNYRVRMPSSAGTTRAYIKADVANIEVSIPDGVAVKLKADVNLSAFEVDESRFPRKGDYYMSLDFESAENRVELELDCDICRVQVK